MLDSTHQHLKLRLQLIQKSNQIDSLLIYFELLKRKAFERHQPTQPMRLLFFFLNLHTSLPSTLNGTPDQLERTRSQSFAMEMVQLKAAISRTFIFCISFFRWLHAAKSRAKAKSIAKIGLSFHFLLNHQFVYCADQTPSPAASHCCFILERIRGQAIL